MKDTGEIVLYGHSVMFFWWPVWAVGLFLAGIAWISCREMQLPGNPKPAGDPLSGTLRPRSFRLRHVLNFGDFCVTIR